MADYTIRTLDEGIVDFGQQLNHRPIADNTRKAFLGDLRIFARFIQPRVDGLGQRTALLASITGDDIKAFLSNQERSGKAASPKSIERRLTSLKVFFKWLFETGHLAHDPADGVAYKPFLDPLPEYLDQVEKDAVIQAARQVAAGERLEHRPLTAIMLVLETGIKKSECLALRIEDIEFEGNSGGSVLIHYQNTKMQFKDRRIPISAECFDVVQSHQKRYKTLDVLFDCTGRNLEYIFNRRIAPLAGLPALTFEMLRWTCAVGDYHSGEMNAEQLQYKYGLSAIGWIEMDAKLARLTKPLYALEHERGDE